jgi:uncharacterized protein YjiS (DUF1127 family)
MLSATLLSRRRASVRVAAGGGPKLAWRRFAARAAALIRTWRDRRLNREYLRTASDMELRDLRMSRFEAQREAAKGFWQP